MTCCCSSTTSVVISTGSFLSHSCHALFEGTPGLLFDWVLFSSPLCSNRLRSSALDGNLIKYLICNFTQGFHILDFSGVLSNVFSRCYGCFI